jgi:hypothetical protein
MLTAPDAANLGLFVLAALLLLVTPGPAVLYIVARSFEQGRRAGLVSMLGVHVGTLVHVAAAAIGVSAVLTASATAFGIVPRCSSWPSCRSSSTSAGAPSVRRSSASASSSCGWD